MSIEYSFNVSRLELCDCKPFKILYIESDLSIDSIDLIINSIIVQRYDFELLEKVYENVTSETDIGTYRYDFPDTDSQPTLQCTGYLKINSNYVTTCQLIGEECDPTLGKDYTFMQYRATEHISNIPVYIVSPNIDYLLIHCDKFLDVTLYENNKKQSFTAIPLTNTITEYIFEPCAKLKIVPLSLDLEFTIINKYKNMIYVNGNTITQHITSSNYIEPLNYTIKLFGNATMTDMIKPFKHSPLTMCQYINRPINDKICPIENELINEHAYYLHCDQCSYDFFLDNVYNWLHINSKCPYCKHEWTIINIFKNCV